MRVWLLRHVSSPINHNTLLYGARVEILDCWKDFNRVSTDSGKGKRGNNSHITFFKSQLFFTLSICSEVFSGTSETYGS